jgi:lactate permease
MDASWAQVYNPLNNLVLSALVASLPVFVLLGLLGIFRVRAHWAALAGLGTAFGVATAVAGMPVGLAMAAAVNGAAYGLFPIGWIVLCAIFVYDVAVFTGKFEIVKHSISGLTSDRRLQALLIAFSFGAFVEGAAGFGTPVAVCAAMLIGLGFPALQAAGLSLIGNTAPVAFGALGTPIIALAGVTGLPLEDLSAMVGRQLPFFSVLVPFWLVWVMAGRKAMMEVWPACLVAGLSFAVPQFLVSNFYGPTLVDIIASLSSIFFLIVLLQRWSPPTIWRLPGEQQEKASDRMTLSRGEIFRAWLPWTILSVLVFIWGIPQIKVLMNSISMPRLAVPFLDNAILRVPPVVPAVHAESAVFVFNWLSATGTAILISGIISGLVLGVRPARLALLFGRTVWRVRMSMLTIAAMLALGFTTRFSGLDATMGLAFASTGFLFPFFSPLLGWLGVALTGSDTASNVLFGNLQQITAQQLGISPVLAAAANSSGGVMGKMIDAQSIVVASVATGYEGHEGEILRYVFFHSVALAVLVGLLVLSQAYLFPGVVP